MLSPLFVKLMYTNYYQIAKQLKSFKIIIVTPTCFEGALNLCFAEVTVLTSVTYRYLRLSILWLHILFSPVMRVDRALCRFSVCTVHEARLRLLFVFAWSNAFTRIAQYSNCSPSLVQYLRHATEHNSS